MNSATKLFEAMRRNPLDWRIEQLQTVARQHSMTGGRTPACLSAGRQDLPACTSPDQAGLCEEICGVGERRLIHEEPVRSFLRDSPLLPTRAGHLISTLLRVHFRRRNRREAIANGHDALKATIAALTIEYLSRGGRVGGGAREPEARVPNTTGRPPRTRGEGGGTRPKRRGRGAMGAGG